MGMPMICSKKVQSATAYLREGVNGYLFNPLDEDNIAYAFKRIMLLDDRELLAMSRQSHQLGVRYVLDDWCRKVSEFVCQKHIWKMI